MKGMKDNFNAMIPQIDAIYISGSFFEMMNGQSCDCDKLIIKCGNRYPREEATFVIRRRK